MQASNDERFVVVVNGDKEYSIWPLDRPTPLGWRSAGFEGERQDCLDYIRDAVADRRPMIVRHHLGEA